MKVIILDGYTLNPGDLHWEGFEMLGDCVVYDRTDTEDVIERCRHAEIVITNKTPLTKEMLAELPDLKYIGVLATGYNVVDVHAATERGIPVANVPVYGTKSVAQMVFALILELTQHIGYHSKTVSGGRWEKSLDFCYWDHPLIELDSLTMGLIGFGRIGQSAGQLADAFGMKIIAQDIRPPQYPPDWAEMTDIDTIFRESDIISLHCPLSPENTGMVDASKIEMMKKSALLINTSRGPLINEKDLAEALRSGKIAGAGLDVLSVEPPRADNPLLKAKNCIITPHIAWATKAARTRLMDTAVDNVKAFINGKAQNVVNL